MSAFIATAQHLLSNLEAIRTYHIPNHISYHLIMYEPIAIVGLSFKLPQEAENESGFWKLLVERRNAMTEWPSSRVNLETFYDADSKGSGKVSEKLPSIK